MMTWQKQLKGDALSWLLANESANVRYLTLRDLIACPADDKVLLATQKASYKEDPIAAILANMDEAGYWVKPGPGYIQKYRSTVWSLIALGQLGATVEGDGRISRACAYLLDHALTDAGQFSQTGAPSGTIDCLQGNLCAALLDLEYEDSRLDAAFEWMARSVTGEGVAPAQEQEAEMRYYASNCGPVFACGYNNKQACAWGGIKVLMAFSKLPVQRRTPLIDSAIQTGVDFLLSVDPAAATYPSKNNGKPSANWWKFGFPVFYIADLLQNVETLLDLGFGGDPRLHNALDLIRAKQDEQGRWQLEYSYAGRVWADFGEKGEPNPWVTLRALRVLKKAV